MFDCASGITGEVLDDGHAALVEQQQAADEFLLVGCVGASGHGGPSVWLDFMGRVAGLRGGVGTGWSRILPVVVPKNWTPS